MEMLTVPEKAVNSMEAVAAGLAEHLIQKLSQTPLEQRLLVGIAGVPASGKSTLAKLIVDDVNRRLTAVSEDLSDNEVAVLVGLDGWHLTRAQLDAFPDPIQAHARRGAHWTFDGQGYVEFVRALRRPSAPQSSENSPTKDTDVVYAPSFLHAIKDPAPNTVFIHPRHRLVIIEGLYTFLAIDPWAEAGKALDERWWVDISEDDAEKRLVPRHVETGVAKDLEEAIWRARENDAPSTLYLSLQKLLADLAFILDGRFIKANLLEPTRTITALEDPLYVLRQD
ncbi:hypothetical protein EIP91_010382 [Steccherinum ochraceum]|uniref:Phosphoribulokinase/uridine kinase domain-containing protein n=1 Tax=Steccherinum ochraceum TaxID=92696 RepID=A0A4R0RNF6_9APHY|nr:hypothetical protein EIP91_010382 [Steccherinum ochraceum]